MILETERLYLREMKQSDFTALCKILQDKEVMYAYEHAFDDTEVQAWLDKQIQRYHDFGFGLWAVILKETREMIGQCGLPKCCQTKRHDADGQTHKTLLRHGYAAYCVFCQKII